jgi:methanogenic corrinoid protein MtbC1
MGDFNDHPRVSGFDSAGSAARASRTQSDSHPEPIWRISPALRPRNVVRAITTQIIPKITSALRSVPALQPAATENAPPTREEQFAALVLGPHDDAAMIYVDGLLSAGVTIESVFLDVLAPTARHLGELWESDVTDFANVTLGMSRMHRILRNLGDRFCDDHHQAGGECALLATIPGEQHSFGLAMVAEFFRRAGWFLNTGPFVSRQELTLLVQERWFDVIGFSVTSDRRLDELRQDIRDLRRDSRNQNVGIIVGGPILEASPELAASLGADLVANDARTAAAQARDLVERIRRRS